MAQARLIVDGHVDTPQSLSFAELVAMAEEHQVRDVSRFDPKRQGDGIKLSGLLQLAKVRNDADYLGLHSSADDFHASVPLKALGESPFLIYSVAGQPLPSDAGGPYRFFIPNHAACHTDEIDECANVKFVDRIELTVGKGFDNRPEDDEEHQRLHDN